MKKTKVAIVKVKKDISTSVEKAIELVGKPEKYFSGNVLIKPNLLAPVKPEACVTTEPEVVKAIIRIAKNYAKDVSVGESGGFISTSDVKEKFRICGIENVCKEEAVKQLTFESLKQKKINLKYAKKIKKVFIPELCINSSLINVPKIKTHTLTYLTCGIKNLFGCVTGFQKSRIHKAASEVAEFSRVLLSLNHAIKPKLTVVDGINCMEGNGPTHGKPVKLGIVIAGEDPTAIDCVVAEIIGFEKKAIPTISIAQQLRVGTTSLENIQIVGEELYEVKKNFKKPISMHYPRLTNGPRKVMYNYLNITTKPYVIKKNCKKCKKCQVYCPVKAISFEDFPEINYKKCIKCFCCYELCVNKAISVKKSLF